MPAPDPRFDEFVAMVVSAVGGLMVGVHHGDHLRIFGEINQLMAAIIENDKRMRERPDDEALRRAVARLSVGG